MKAIFYSGKRKAEIEAEIIKRNPRTVILKVTSENGFKYIKKRYSQLIKS